MFAKCSQPSLQRTPIQFITLFLSLFGALLLASPSVSANEMASDYQNESIKDPAYVIKSTMDKITTFSSNSDKIDALTLRTFIENEIIPQFDFDNMSHWITGRFAKHMSDENKKEFQQKLRQTFLTSLSKHLGSYDAKNTRIRFYPARYRGEQEAFVSTTVYRPERRPVRLDFRMRLDDTNWKIIDVKANGSSAVVYYRSHFMAKLRGYARRPMPTPVYPMAPVRNY